LDRACPPVAPKEQTFDWNTWNPTTPVSGIDNRPPGTSTMSAIGNMMAQYERTNPHQSTKPLVGGTPIGGGSVSLGAGLERRRFLE